MEPPSVMDSGFEESFYADVDNRKSTIEVDVGKNIDHCAGNIAGDDMKTNEVEEGREGAWKSQEEVDSRKVRFDSPLAAVQVYTLEESYYSEVDDTVLLSDNDDEEPVPRLSFCPSFGSDVLDSVIGEQIVPDQFSTSFEDSMEEASPEILDSSNAEDFVKNCDVLGSYSEFKQGIEQRSNSQRLLSDEFVDSFSLLLNDHVSSPQKSSPQKSPPPGVECESILESTNQFVSDTATTDHVVNGDSNHGNHRELYEDVFAYIHYHAFTFALGRLRALLFPSKSCNLECDVLDQKYDISEGDSGINNETSMLTDDQVDRSIHSDKDTSKHSFLTFLQINENHHPLQGCNGQSTTATTTESGSLCEKVVEKRSVVNNRSSVIVVNKEGTKKLKLGEEQHNHPSSPTLYNPSPSIHLSPKFEFVKTVSASPLFLDDGMIEAEVLVNENISQVLAENKDEELQCHVTKHQSISLEVQGCVDDMLTELVATQTRNPSSGEHCARNFQAIFSELLATQSHNTSAQQNETNSIQSMLMELIASQSRNMSTPENHQNNVQSILSNLLLASQQSSQIQNSNNMKQGVDLVGGPNRFIPSQTCGKYTSVTSTRKPTNIQEMLTELMASQMSGGNCDTRHLEWSTVHEIMTELLASQTGIHPDTSTTNTTTGTWNMESSCEKKQISNLHVGLNRDDDCSQYLLPEVDGRGRRYSTINRDIEFPKHLLQRERISNHIPHLANVPTLENPYSYPPPPPTATSQETQTRQLPLRFKPIKEDLVSNDMDIAGCSPSHIQHSQKPGSSINVEEETSVSQVIDELVEKTCMGRSSEDPLERLSRTDSSIDSMLEDLQATQTRDPASFAGILEDLQATQARGLGPYRSDGASSHRNPDPVFNKKLTSRSGYLPDDNEQVVPDVTMVTKTAGGGGGNRSAHTEEMNDAEVPFSHEPFINRYLEVRTPQKVRCGLSKRKRTKMPPLHPYKDRNSSF